MLHKWQVAAFAWSEHIKPTDKAYPLLPDAKAPLPDQHGSGGGWE